VGALFLEELREVQISRISQNQQLLRAYDRRGEEVKRKAVELLDGFGLISGFKVYSEKGKKINFVRPSIPKMPVFVLQEKADNHSSQ
jgi:hypothetical protein